MAGKDRFSGHVNKNHQADAEDLSLILPFLNCLCSDHQERWGILPSALPNGKRGAKVCQSVDGALLLSRSECDGWGGRSASGRVQKGLSNIY